MIMIMIIIIIIIFISSAALSKIRRAAGTHSVLTKRRAFRRRAKVAMDSVDRRSSAGKQCNYNANREVKHISNSAER